MSDGDWDADEYDAPSAVAPTVQKSLYADEDAEDEVKESWEDSDDEEEQAKKAAAAAAKPAPPIRQKGVTKAKIAEREAAEAAKLQERLALQAEDPRERKKREMQQQIAQDLENARALLGDTALTEAVGGVAATGGEGSPFAAFPNPKTQKEMEAFAASLSKYIVDNYSNKPLYHHFAEALVKGVAQPLKDLEVRKCASALTVIANEKQRQAREATSKKGKGKGKPQLGAVGSGGNKAAMAGRGFSADLDAHHDALDDDYDDDFM